jgi:hypothetical protein
MSSFLIPKSIIKIIDARRRTFFWAAEESCSGAQCLEAWCKVCSPKLLGGLGAKNLNAQNVCLLLKFCFKILHAPNLPWKEWLLHSSPYAQKSHNPSFLGSLITKHMPLLLMVTQCTIGNGSATFFWHDRWLLPESLLTAFLPYTHITPNNTHIFMRFCLMGSKEASVINFLMRRQTSSLFFFLYCRALPPQNNRTKGFCLAGQISPPREHTYSCNKTCKIRWSIKFGPRVCQTKLKSSDGSYTLTALTLELTSNTRTSLTPRLAQGAPTMTKTCNIFSSYAR